MLFNLEEDVCFKDINVKIGSMTRREPRRNLRGAKVLSVGVNVEAKLKSIDLVLH